MFHERDPEEAVRVIVGLGNPGHRYRETRHNAGFQVVDRIAEALSTPVSNLEPSYVWGRTRWGGDEIFLLKPITYMNRSGVAVEEFLVEHDIPGDSILVVHDDVDLPLGRLRIARKGGAGGHRGVASIIEHLRHQSFPRVRVGIGRPRYGEPMQDYVLGVPYEDEREAWVQSLDAAALAVRLILKSGLTLAMNRVNGRKPGEPMPD